MTQMTTHQLYDESTISTALNRAADDIIAAVDAPDEGVRDALNLCVNAALHYLKNPSDSLDDAIVVSYGSHFEDGDGPLAWIATCL